MLGILLLNGFTSFSVDNAEAEEHLSEFQPHSGGSILFSAGQIDDIRK